jgi:hypothetical protein
MVASFDVPCLLRKIDMVGAVRGVVVENVGGRGQSCTLAVTSDQMLSLTSTNHPNSGMESIIHNRKGHCKLTRWNRSDILCEGKQVEYIELP